MGVHAGYASRWYIKDMEHPYTNLHANLKAQQAWHADASSRVAHSRIFLVEVH